MSRHKTIYCTHCQRSIAVVHKRPFVGYRVAPTLDGEIVRADNERATVECTHCRRKHPVRLT